MIDNAEEGVIDLHCQAHKSRGLRTVDRSIVPTNPDVNPGLRVAALAEYAMSRGPAQASQPAAWLREVQAATIT